MTTCAWHDDGHIDPPTPFFDPATSHGICLYCAMNVLMSRPRALIRFLLRQGYSRDGVAFLMRRMRTR